MVEQSRHLSLADLRQRINALMDRLESDPSFPKQLSFDHDAYWTTSPEEAVTINTGPTMMVGSLQDDLEFLSMSERAPALQLEALAAVLRYYSRVA